MMNNTKEKGKFNEALKLFDNKEYKNAKKACEKILDKQPTHADTLALKGLVMGHMNEKVEGAKCINDAIRLNFKNATAWHFLALFHKEDKNYPQAMRSYVQAQKHDPENFNVVRDLSYLQLYLRQYNSFLETARRGMEIRANMLINWTTYAFANYLVNDYAFAYKLLDSCLKIGATSVKDNEKHEILLFQSSMLIKQNKFEEALTFLTENEKFMNFDKMTFLEKMILVTTKLQKKELALSYINKALLLNSENANYFVNYLNSQKDLNINSFEELLKFVNVNPEISQELLKIIQEDLKPRIKSRIINRLELALSNLSEFKTIFCLYFLQNVKQNLPSVFIGVKFIYLFQENKIPIIEEILTAHLNSIKNNGKLDENYANGELLDLPHNFIWVYYYAAQHYDYLRNLEKALFYINLAIDSTPSIVEFFMVKSKILKHGGLFEESAKSYEKAKKLDLGDRYLNARYAKIYARIGDVNKSVEIMKEFVRDPLTDENIDHFQCMWYETECGYAYLKNRNILKAHRLFKSIFIQFNTLIEDQFDFYNYCLRRFMINDFANTIEYMDRISDNKYVYKALEAFEIILHYLKTSDSNVLEKQLSNEFEEIQKDKEKEKYKFQNSTGLINEIESDLYHFCLKLQAYSKNLHLHNLSVKKFLAKDKVLLALKSLLYLQKHAHGTYEYLDSLHFFNHYLTEKKDTIPQVYLELIHEKVDLFKSEETLLKFLKTENTKLENNLRTSKHFIHALLADAYESIFKQKHTIEKTFDNFLENNQTALRQIKSDHLNKLTIYLNLFSNEEFTQKILSSYREKIKIEGGEKELIGNLNFYEKHGVQEISNVKEEEKKEENK